MSESFFFFYFNLYYLKYPIKGILVHKPGASNHYFSNITKTNLKIGDNHLVFIFIKFNTVN